MGGCMQDLLLGGAGLASGVVCFAVLAALRKFSAAETQLLR